MEGIMGPLGTAIKGIKYICESVQTVKQNQSRCKKLAEKLTRLEGILKSLAKNDAQDVKTLFTDFNDFIDRLTRYINKLQQTSKAKQLAFKVLRLKSEDEKLDEFETDLRDRMVEMTLLLASRSNLGVEQYVNLQPVTGAEPEQEEDEADSNLSEANIIATLETNTANVKKAEPYLNYLYEACKDKNPTSSTDRLLQLFLTVMRTYPTNLNIQISGTAGMFVLIHKDPAPTLDLPMVGRIINACIGALHSFPQEEQIHTNALWTLYLAISQYLEDINALNNLDVDRVRCATVLMNTLSNSEMPVLIHISLVVGREMLKRVNAEQKGKLGSEKLMKKLVQSAEQTHIGMREGALAMMVTLTDECPPNCETLVKMNFLRAIKPYLQKGTEDSDEVPVVYPLLVVGNVVLVKQLRLRLLQDDLLLMLRERLATETEINNSFLAASAVAALLSSPDKKWPLNTRRDTILDTLEETVLAWPVTGGALHVYFNTLRPFLENLVQYDAPAIQLWALWTLNCLLQQDGGRYGPMIFHEGLHAVLSGLSQSSKNEKVIHFCSMVLQAADPYQSYVYTPVQGETVPN